ncbi:MAG: TVP38/TMEM64 family protein [Chloroflexota bacterium]
MSWIFRAEWFPLVQQMFSAASMNAMADYLRGFGLWTLVVSLIMMILQAVIAPLPSTLIIGANGVIFGVWQGVLLSWFGVLAGASMSYWLARWLGREFIIRWLGTKHMQQVDQMSERDGFWIVLMARLIPIISLDVISYLAGLSRMEYWRFIIASAIGMLPSVIVYTIIAHDLALAQLSIWRISILGILAIVVYISWRWWQWRQHKTS